MRGASFMEIYITNDAAKWFEEEMFLEKGDSIRFFVKYGGSTPVQEGFSLGINKEAPSDPIVKTMLNGILYYVEEKDLWYFDEHNLHVGYNKDLDEPFYEYKKS